jgi:hypothetical protein
VIRPYPLAACALVAASVASAARADPDPDRAARRDKVIAAVRAEAPIVVDGKLDDATWRGAPFVADFTQKEPRQDAAPADATEVAIAFDDDALYVAARMSLADPALLDRPMTRRDDTKGAERFIVSLDPYRSRRTAYSFAITAAGVRADWIHTDDSESARDHSWNPVWSGAVALDDAGWTAELRIPFSQLRFPASAAPVWGINFNRFIPRTREDDFWIVVPKDRTGWASYFGELRGLDGVAPRLRLEVLPYVSGSLAIRSRALVGDDDPFAEPLGPGGAAGVDLKLGLGPDLTVDATVNPDFGQVEADPAVVNLGAFEITLPERRPFFIEGSPIFASQPRRYFYSRRIGGPPRLTADGRYVDQPDATRILGAAKLTGKLAPRTNIGAIAAVTAPARARSADDPAAPATEVLVAPLTGWGIVRLERELRGGGVGGATFTGVVRDDADPRIRDALPRAAIAGGADARIRSDDGVHEVFAAVGGSAVAGAPAAIAAIQRSSAHYFQRPDADHVAVDPDDTLLAGWHADVSAARRAGAWRYSVGAGAESPDLELNDVGVLSSGDDVGGYVSVNRVETVPGRHLHGWTLRASDSEEWNFGGVHTIGHTAVGASATLPSFVRMSADVAVARPAQSDDATRGGPLMATGWGGWGSVGVARDGSARLDWSASASGDWSETGSVGVRAGVSIGWWVVDRLRLQLSPSARALTEARQYVAAVGGTAGGAATFGTRYVFATLVYRQVATQLRAQLALSPDLTVDAYVEPFATSGRYVDFGELPAPRALELRRYLDAGARVSRDRGVVVIDDAGDRFALADPDFTYLSLRSTVVVRWELAPGSVLYAVWQQGRSRDDGVARGVGGAVLRDVFTAPATHVVAVKLSYWWAP